MAIYLLDTTTLTHLHNGNPNLYASHNSPVKVVAAPISCRGRLQDL